MNTGAETEIMQKSIAAAADVFKTANRKIYKSANKAAADDPAALEEGRLSELTEFRGVR